MKWVAAGLGFVIAATSVLGVFAMLDSAVRRLTPMESLVEIRLRPDRDVPLILGSGQLVQPRGGAMAEAHVALIRLDDAVVAHDIAHTRRIGLQQDNDVYSDTASLEIPQGRSTLRVGATVISVSRDGDTLNIETGDPAASTRLAPTGARVEASGTAPVEVTSGVFDRLEWWFGIYVTGDFAVTWRLGAPAGAADHAALLARRTIPDASLPPDAVRFLYRVNEGAGSWTVVQTRLPVFLERAGQPPINPEARAIVLIDAAGEVVTPRLVLGRTTYAISAGSGTGEIVLRPLLRNGRVAAQDVMPTDDPRILSRILVERPFVDLSILRSSALWAALTAVALILVFGQSGAPRAVAVGAAGLVLAIVGDQGLMGVAGSLPLFVVVGAGFMAGVLVAMLGPGRMRHIWRIGWLRAALLVPVLGILAFAAPPLSVPGTEKILLGAGLALLAPLLSARLPLVVSIFWALLIAVAGLGVVVGMTLAALEPTGANDAKFLRHLTALALIGFVCALVLDARDTRLARSLFGLVLPGVKRRRWLGWLLGLLMLFFLVLLLVTDETGLQGRLQPSELAKSLLVIVVALTLIEDLARRSMLSAGEGGQSVIRPFLAIAFVIVVLLMSVRNYDLSPILVSGASILVVFLTGAWLHVMAMRQGGKSRRFAGLPIIPPDRFPGRRAGELWWIALRRRHARIAMHWPAFVLAFSAVLIAIFATVVVSSQFTRLSSDPGSGVFGGLLTPWLRFQSWADMDLYAAPPFIDFPHAGTQLLRAREAFMTFGCMAESWLACPLPNAGLDPALSVQRLLAVPEGDDDFAAVSIVFALGLDGAAIYLSLQAALAGVALMISISALWVKGPMRIWGLILGCTSLGLTLVYAGQVVLGWGNVLGLTPIMGQPMSFVSLGASHHLFFALPFAIAVVASGSLAEQAPEQRGAARRDFFRRRLA